MTGFLFDSSTTPTYDKSNATLQSEGWIASDGNLAAEHDAAQVHWGGGWRMPTDADMQTLTSNTTTEWIMTNGVTGRLVRGKGAFADKSIFLPAAGYGSRTSLNDSGSLARYWSSAPRSGDSYDAWYLYFDSGDFNRYDYYRYDGQSVRPLRGFADSARIACASDSSIIQLIASESVKLSLDTRQGARTIAAGKEEAIRYNPQWGDGESCSLTINGKEVENATSDGVYAWTRPAITDTTYWDFVLTVGSTVLTRRFEITSEERNGLTSVIIPDGVTSIGANAFAGCVNLLEVTIPESITSIGENAFGGTPFMARLEAAKAILASKLLSGEMSSEPEIQRYDLTGEQKDRAIASVTIDSDAEIDQFVLVDGKVYDSVVRIVNAATVPVTVTLPAGYNYETIGSANPLRIPAASTNLLSITLMEEKTFLVTRKALRALQ